MTLDDRLVQIFRDVLEDDDLILHEAMSAADVPGWDSLATVNLMFVVEQEYDVTFADEQFAGFPSIGALQLFLDNATR